MGSVQYAYMYLLPPLYVVSIVFIFGLIIGSFLDVIVSRFHTGKSINGRSRCMSCGHTLSWYELFPFLSYVILRGRCKSCGGHIPTRLLLMELITAISFLLVYFNTETFSMFLFGLVLMSLLIVIAAYDMRHMVIPHEFVFGAFFLATIHLALVTEFFANMYMVLPYIFSGIACFAFYGGLWVVSKGKWIGLGDAKLALPLGLMLTYTDALSFVIFSFWIGAFVSLALLLGQKLLVSGKKHLPFINVPLTMRSEVPFAPFMILAFIVVFLLKIDVFTITGGFF